MAGSVSDLRKFRSSVAKLKQRGLLPDRTSLGNKLDARSAQPSWKLPNGKKLSTIVNKYDDVVSGKVTPLKVTPERAKQFRKAGFQVDNHRVLIPHSSSERAVIERGEVVIKSASGIERVQIPIPYHNLDQYLRDIAADSERINAMKHRNEYFGFRFYGNNSATLYSNIEGAIEDLAKYNSVLDATSRYKQREVYKNLEIVRVGRKAPWVFPSERRHAMSKEYNRKRMQRFRERLKRKPKFVQEHYSNMRNERQKAYRKRLSRNPKKSKAYKLAAKKRAKLSRESKLKQKKAKKRTQHAKNRRNRS